MIVEHYIKTKKGETRVVHLDGYLVRQSVLEEIVEYAEAQALDDDGNPKGHRNAKHVWYDTKHPLRIFDDVVGKEVDLYPITVAWYHSEFYGTNQAYERFSKYSI